MEIVILVVLAGLFWWGLVRGNLYPPLLMIFAVAGGRMLITRWIPSSSATVMTFMDWNVSYASFAAALIAVLGIGYFLRDDE